MIQVKCRVRGRPPVHRVQKNQRHSKRPSLVDEVTFSDAELKILDDYVAKKHKLLGDEFVDGIVAAEATMEHILDVIETFLVTSVMVASSRIRQKLEIPWENRCRDQSWKGSLSSNYREYKMFRMVRGKRVEIKYKPSKKPLK